jgi:hypothetical protein
MCGKYFKKIDLKDYKIVAFTMKNRVLFAPFQTGSTNFEFSRLKTILLHKVWICDIMLKIEVRIP